MKYIKLIIIFIFIILLSACDYTEIEDLAIITGIIIDYKDNNYELTSEILENNDKTNIRVITNSCSDINICMYKLSKTLNKKVFISHLKALILTENTIKNTDNYYDYFLRDTKSKMNFNIYYIDNEYKDKLFEIYKNNDGTSLFIRTLSNINNNTYSSSVELSFLDLINNDVIIYPSLIIENNNIVLSSPVIFKDNKKIILNETETIYYNMLKNKLNKSIIEIKCDKGNYSLIIDHSKAKYSYKDNTFNIDISIKSNLNSYNCNYKLNDTKTITLLSKLSNKHIEKNI